MMFLYESEMRILEEIDNVGKLSITSSNIPKINKVPESLMKWRNQFNKLNPQKILKIMGKFYDKQYNTILNTCIEYGNVKANEMKELYHYIHEHISPDDYKSILAEHTEDYSLFRTGLISTYMFITLYSIYAKSRLLMTLTYDSYAIYTYSLLFKKYFNKCRPETFQNALSSVHKLNLMNKFKENGHISIIDHVVFQKISTMIKMLNTKGFDVVTFSRSYSYIKTTFNQTFNKFANNAYYPYMNRTEDGDVSTGINSSELSMILSDIMQAHTQIKQLPQGYGTFISKQVKSLNKDSIINFLDDHVAKNNDINYRTYLETIYKFMFINFPLNDMEDICTQKYVVDLMNDLNTKVKSPNIIKMKNMIDNMNNEVISGVDKQRFDKPKIKLQYRKIFIIYLYQLYIRHALCMH